MPDDPTAIPAEDLAQLDDRWTVRYVRLLPAGVPRVWDAVTRAEELNVWFLPVVTIEAKLGGRCTTSWGAPESMAESWTVTRFEPRKVFELAHDEHAHQLLRFELEPVDAKTRLTFVNRLPVEMRPDDLDLADAHPHNKLLALPAGRDTPLRAGILEGYHLTFDNLGPFVAHEWNPGELEKISNALVARANATGGERFPNRDEPLSPLVEFYFDYIREHCPPV
jgi:uncharacterized protein YndB with AHSA1/START domain